MRLLHASNYHSPYPGSFIPMLRAALRLGLERGLRAEAVFEEGARGRDWLDAIAADGIPVRLVPHGGLAELLAEDDGPTILHVHFSALQIEAARAARRRPGTWCWWHVHTVLNAGAMAKARNAVRFGLVGRSVEEILCVAPDLADSVRGRLGARSKVHFFPNAIDLERFRPATAADRTAARERLGLPADKRVLMHFGRDWHGKGGDLYEAAATALPDDVVAVSVGAPRGVGVRTIDPTPRVEDVYAAADVFVSPSRAEGMPFAVAEALASGTPVVASDIPGQRYVCEQHGGCRLVPLDAGALAEGIERALGDGMDMPSARAWLEANMDVDAWAERLFDRYAAAGALT